MLLERKCSYAFYVLRTLRKNFWVFGETIWTCTSNPNSSCPKQSSYKTQIFWKNQVFWQFQEFKWWFLDFGMKILAENFQQGFLDCNRCLYGNVLRFCLKFFFSVLVFGVMFLWTFGGTFKGGLLKPLFYVLREILRRITSKTLNMFQKLWILIEIFSYFDESFHAALCKVHSKCPEEYLEWIFSLKTPGISS